MAKYDAEQLKALGAKGHAFKNADGSYSYPIDDVEDLKNAIHAVGRGNADHNALRKYIMGRADALGQKALIPDNWQADGSLSDAKSASRAAPTAQDAVVSAKLTELGAALAAAMQAQQADPDNLTDPDDISVWSHLQNMQALLNEANDAQSEDGSADPDGDDPADADDRSARIPAQVKRGLFADTREHEPPVAGLIQVRLADLDTDQTAHFTGYAATTGVGYDVTDWLGSYRETVMPGAFAKTLRETEYVPFLIDHDGFPLASTSGGTMQLAEDGTGLRTDAQLDRRQGLANDLTIALQRGDLSKMSFAFRAVTQNWNADYSDRQVSELQLFDASVVKNPANPTTSAGLRSEMLDAVGREGRSVMLTLAPAIADLRSERRADMPADDLERALKVLRSVDDHFRSYRYTGRARTFLVASLLGEARAGAVLSAANQKLLDNAVGAFSEGMTHLGSLDAAAKAAAKADGDGTVNDDGSVPRHADLNLEVAAARAAALRLARPRLTA